MFRVTVRGTVYSVSLSFLDKRSLSLETVEIEVMALPLKNVRDDGG